MNPEIKKQWIEALRSGEYRQGENVLRGAGNYYCCLGVLCDLHAKATQTEWATPESTGRFDYQYLHHMELPSRIVMDWAGLPDDKVSGNTEGGYDIRVTQPPAPADYNEADVVSSRTTLAELNDNGRTFKQIAQVIEDQL